MAPSPPSDATPAATNTTLASALGSLGGRQKSWMIEAPPPAPPAAEAVDAPTPAPLLRRPRGRPPKPPLPLRAPVCRSIEVAPVVAAATASRKPPDPVRAPSMAAGEPGRAAITVLPSPTPSEENSSDDPPAPAPHEEAVLSSNVGFLDLVAIPAGYPPDTPLETVFIDAARQGTTATKRAANGTDAQVEKRMRIERAPALPQTHAVTADARIPFQAARAQRPDQLHHARLLPMTQGHVDNAQAAPTHGRRPSYGQPLHAGFPSPQTPQSLVGWAASAGPTPPQIQSPFSPPVQSQPGRATQHAPTYTPMPVYVPPRNDWYTATECLHILDVFQSSMTPSPNHPRDDSRLAVLKDAIVHEDWPYLTMHQYYCLLTHNSATIPVEVRQHPDMPKALELLRSVLDSNDSLSPPVHGFFCKFPYPISHLAGKCPNELKFQMQIFLDFVSHSSNFDRLKVTWEQRRCPPLVGELAVDLQIASCTFQRLLFTMILRSIWKTLIQSSLQSKYEAQAIALFTQNQVEFYQQATMEGRTNLPTDSTYQQDKIQEYQHWVPQLKNVVLACEVASHNLATAANNRRPSHPQYPQAQLQAQPQVLNQAQPLMHTQAQITQTMLQHQQFSAANMTSNPGPSIGSSSIARPPPPHLPSLAPAAPPQPRKRGRPRIYPLPPLQPAQILPSQSLTQQAPQPLQPPAPPPPGVVTLLPPAGWIQPQQRVPAPVRFSLHQAHLQSPLLRARSPSSSLYHYVHDFCVKPFRLINAGCAVERLRFTLTAAQMCTVPRLDDVAMSGLTFTGITELSKTLRVRCLKWPGETFPKQHEWTVTDTSWIPNSYLRLNDKSLQQRKKVHHGKDLAIDITAMLQEGENTLEMTVLSQADDTSFRDYILGIEILSIVSHASIKALCQTKNHLPSQVVLDGIIAKLTAASETNDDDLTITQSNISISLFDPFSASSICTIPVRGETCAHSDAFDLDTFLQTRRRKGDVSDPDQWRCPICGGDARPHRLVLDGFLEEVRAHLEEQGKLDTRAIVVKQDGSWAPKVEVSRESRSVTGAVCGGGDAAGKDADAGVAMGGAAEAQRPVIPADVEVIDLSD